MLLYGPSIRPFVPRAAFLFGGLIVGQRTNLSFSALNVHYRSKMSRYTRCRGQSALFDVSLCFARLAVLVLSGFVAQPVDDLIDDSAKIRAATITHQLPDHRAAGSR